MPYSLDTSSLLEAWTRRYPPEMFPPVWRKLEEMAGNGTIFVTEEVLEELKKKDDDLPIWLREHGRDGSMIVKHETPIQEKVREILRSHRKIIDTRRGRSGADPFVIAVAAVRGLTVVTQEDATESSDRPAIPDVCKAYGVACTNFMGMLKAERFTMQ